MPIEQLYLLVCSKSANLLSHILYSLLTRGVVHVQGSDCYAQQENNKVMDCQELIEATMISLVHGHITRRHVGQEGLRFPETHNAKQWPWKRCKHAVSWRSSLSTDSRQITQVPFGLFSNTLGIQPIHRNLIRCSAALGAPWCLNLQVARNLHLSPNLQDWFEVMLVKPKAMNASENRLGVFTCRV